MSAVTETDYPARINKLDSFFLWVASLSGIGFSIFIAYFKLPIIIYAPVFVLIAIGVGVGYLNGGVFGDSFTNRMRGWTYLLIGLGIYGPFAAIKFSEEYMVQFYSEYTKLEPTLSSISGLAIVGCYIVAMIKLTPKIYESFGLKFGTVTKRILTRSALASVVLGFTLFFIIVSSSTLLSDMVSFAVFIILTILLLYPISIQEKRIKKLAPLEKYQDCVSITVIEKRVYFILSLILCGFFTGSLLVLAQLSIGGFPVAVLMGLVFGFIASVMMLFLSIFHSDRGDMIILKENLERNLSETQEQELHLLVNKANS